MQREQDFLAPKGQAHIHEGHKATHGAFQQLAEVRSRQGDLQANVDGSCKAITWFHIRGSRFPFKRFVTNLKSLILQCRTACYAPGMTPHERCLQALAAVVQFDDASGIILMEQAIDALIQAAGTDSVSKILALDDLTEDLIGNGWNTDGRGSFASTSLVNENSSSVTSALTYRKD